MCGIWAIFGYKENLAAKSLNAFEIAHRGPDFHRVETVLNYSNCLLAFYRLSIAENLVGEQPFRLMTLPHLKLLYNGEIYNYKELMQKYGFEGQSTLDGEVILHLYNKFGMKKTLQLLDGVYAVMIFDGEKGEIHIGRDTFGVRPIFTLRAPTGELGISSEAKGLIGLLDENSGHKVHPFVPGTYASFSLCKQTGLTSLIIEERFTDVHVPQEFDIKTVLTNDVQENIRNLLTEACDKRLMGIRRIGCLLSGGLDSSLIAALVVKLLKEKGVPYPVQTFSIGLPGSPDLINAKRVADMLQTEHHEILFSAEEAFNTIKKCNYSLESYDITTNRASICMYLLAKYIRENTDTTIIFSGEGSDELTQGYIYFHKAPDALSAHEESKRLLRDLYLYDNLRADRTVSAHGLELRVPFLDKAFTSYYLSIPKEMVQPTNNIEKYLLRKSFDGHLKSLLPDEVLWRAKEAFSDGVSKKEETWSEQLERFSKSQLNPEELQKVDQMYQFNTPRTFEALYYRKAFESKFPGHAHLIPYFWLPKWMGEVTDPSARVLQHYKQ